MKNIKLSIRAKLFKITLLNDIQSLALADFDIKKIQDHKTFLKYRNLNKSVNIFSAFTDETLGKEKIQNTFGDYADYLNDLIDQKIAWLEQKKQDGNMTSKVEYSHCGSSWAPLEVMGIMFDDIHTAIKFVKSTENFHGMKSALRLRLVKDSGTIDWNNF